MLNMYSPHYAVAPCSGSTGGRVQWHEKYMETDTQCTVLTFCILT